MGVIRRLGVKFESTREGVFANKQNCCLDVALDVDVAARCCDIIHMSRSATKAY